VSVVLTELREAGLVRMHEVVDRTRGVIGYRGAPTIRAGVLKAIEHTRLDLWDGESPLLIVESESLAGVLERVAYNYRVPLVPLRGQASTGLLGAELPGFLRQSATVLHLGDLDRSAIDIERSAHVRAEAYSGLTLDWHRTALTNDQAEEHGLEPIWKKDGRDGRLQEAIEAEALGQPELVAIVRSTLDGLLPAPLAAFEADEQAQRLAVIGALEDEEDDE
jgi:hypothetical protein